MGKKTVVFLLLLLLLSLGLMSSCSDEKTPTQTTANGMDTVVTTPQTTAQTTAQMTTPSVENNETPMNLSYETETNLSDNGITVPSASFVSGTLLTVNDEYSYRYGVTSLVPVSEIFSSVSHLKEQNLIRLYGNKSQNYLLAFAHIFLKEDAFQPWEDLISAFVADTGKKSVQVVSAYTYSGEESLSNEMVTGYSIAINLYENGANYSLASSEQTVTVNGKTMTCLEWFQDHCVRYGFIYTGLTGTQARALATFRYVGVPHALAMQRLDYVDTQEYASFLRYYSQTHTVTDFENNITWNIDFYPAEQGKALTEINIPKGAVYTLSGNNIDGFIVAYYMP